MIESVKDIVTLHSLKREIGTIVYVEENNEDWQMTEDGWVEMEKHHIDGNNSFEIDIYSLNKQIKSNLPEILDWNEINTILKEYLNKFNNSFYLLYGRDINYFTLFNIDENSDESFTDVLRECLENIGTVVEITANDVAVEIWVKIDNDAIVLYLFDYDKGVIKTHA